MTNDERREYMREWREKNRDKIRRQRTDRSRRDALAALKSVKPIDAKMFVMKSTDGRSYIVGGLKK